MGDMTQGTGLLQPLKQGVSTKLKMMKDIFLQIGWDVKASNQAICFNNEQNDKG